MAFCNTLHQICGLRAPTWVPWHYNISGVWNNYSTKHCSGLSHPMVTWPRRIPTKQVNGGQPFWYGPWGRSGPMSVKKTKRPCSWSWEILILAKRIIWSWTPACQCFNATRRSLISKLVFRICKVFASNHFKILDACFSNHSSRNQQNIETKATRTKLWTLKEKNNDERRNCLEQFNKIFF